MFVQNILDGEHAVDRRAETAGHFAEGVTESDALH
jgi:hypothetical protein